MRNYNIPMLDTEKGTAFAEMQDDLLNSVMDEIHDVLQHEMMENEIQESQSIKIATRFFTTL